MPDYNRNSAGSMKGMINDNENRPLRVDSSTHCIQTLSYEHHEIHAGNYFTCQEGFVLNNAARSYLIRPPKSSKECHMEIHITGSQDTSFAFYENSGYDPGLKCVTGCRNRIINTISETEINIAAGGAGAPTLLVSGQFGIAATAGGRGGGSGVTSSREEVILSPNFKYAFTVTALSANVNNITVSFDFYEHTPKN